MKYQRSKFSVFIIFLFLFQFNLWAKTVIGVVTDVKSGLPLESVMVMIIDTANVILVMQNTDRSGVFFITGINQDRINIRTYRYGYVSTTTGPYNLATHDTLSMLINLEAVPISLGEVVVTATATLPYLDRVHFYERKEMGMGYYKTWNDFKNRGVSNVYYIFLGIPGLIVRNDAVFYARYLAYSDVGAVPQPLIYVDGILVPNEINGIGWLTPESIQAVEVYNSLNAPAQYSKGRTGGVILIWTKQ